jgi:two-component system nitrate/nitrite response regulator NarL
MTSERETPAVEGPTPTRVFIVAGMRLYREGLADLLARTSCVEVVGTHSGGLEVVPHLMQSPPDVLLLDMGAPDSYDTARALERDVPDVPTVALGIGNSESERLRCAEVGIIGYVSDNAPASELVQVIERAARGEALCSPKLAGQLVRKLAALARDRDTEPLRGELTRREREVVALIEQDCSNKEIAQRLGIEVATVKNHVHNLLEKLSVRRRSEIVRILKLPRSAAASAAAQLRGRSSRAS